MQANGRLAALEQQGLCRGQGGLRDLRLKAGKRQAAALEQQEAYGQRAWWRLPRGGVGFKPWTL